MENSHRINRPFLLEAVYPMCALAAVCTVFFFCIAAARAGVSGPAPEERELWDLSRDFSLDRSIHGMQYEDILSWCEAIAISSQRALDAEEEKLSRIVRERADELDADARKEFLAVQNRWNRIRRSLGARHFCRNDHPTEQEIADTFLFCPNLERSPAHSYYLAATSALRSREIRTKPLEDGEIRNGPEGLYVLPYLPGGFGLLTIGREIDDGYALDIGYSSETAVCDLHLKEGAMITDSRLRFVDSRADNGPVAIVLDYDVDEGVIILTIEETETGETPNPYCGFRASLEGEYLRLSPVHRGESPGDRPD